MIEDRYGFVKSARPGSAGRKVNPDEVKSTPAGTCQCKPAAAALRKCIDDMTASLAALKAVYAQLGGKDA